MILLIGHGSPDAAGNAEFLQFAQMLEVRLGVPTQPCFLELAEPTIGEGVDRCVAAGAQQIVTLPLFLGPGRHQKRDVPDLLAAAQSRHPGVTVAYGTPVGPHLRLVDALADRAAAALEGCAEAVDHAETALVVVGRGSRDTQSNAELARIARMLYERGTYGMVEYAFQLVVAPNVGQAITRCVRLGARRVVVLPYLLFTGFVRDDIRAQVAAAQALYPEIDMLVGEHLFPHAGLLDAVVQRYTELVTGVAAMTCDLCVYRQRGVDADDHHHHHHDHHDHHADHHHHHHHETGDPV